MSQFRPKRLWRALTLAALASAQSVQAGGLFDTRADCNNGGAAPALSAFTLVGSGVVTMSSNPSIITTTALVPAGALLVVTYWIDSGGLGTVVVNSVTDTNSDTFTAVGSNINNSANPHVAMNAFTGKSPAGMASSSQIKLTTSATSGGAVYVFVGYVTGGTNVDIHVGSLGGSTFNSQSTGTLNHAPSLAIGPQAARGGLSPPGAFGGASGFTLTGSQLVAGNDRVALQIQTTQSSGTGSVTYAPPGSGLQISGDMLFNLYATAPAC